MKKIFFILFFIVIVLSAQSQKIAQVFTSDTTKGAETVYYTVTSKVDLYQGIAIFQFTGAHDVMTAYLQGSNGGSVSTEMWWDADTVAVSGSPAVNYKLEEINPKYIYYRTKFLGN